MDKITTKGPIAWMAKNPVASNLLMLTFLTGGIVGIFKVNQEVFPQFELDTISISVSYPGASPEETEQGIVLAVEEAVGAWTSPAAEPAWTASSASLHRQKKALRRSR